MIKNDETTREIKRKHILFRVTIVESLYVIWLVWCSALFDGLSSTVVAFPQFAGPFSNTNSAPTVCVCVCVAAEQFIARLRVNEGVSIDGE